MGRKKLRRMLADEFAILRPILALHLSEDRCAAAHMALVEGRTLQEIAGLYGWSRAAVDDAVGRVWSLAACYRETRRIAAALEPRAPAGWASATLLAPRPLLRTWRAQLAQLAHPLPALPAPPSEQPRWSEPGTDIPGSSRPDCEAAPPGPAKAPRGRARKSGKQSGK